MKPNIDLFHEAECAIENDDSSAALKKLLQQFRKHPTTRVGDCIVKLGNVVGSRSKLGARIDLEQLKVIKRSEQSEVLSPLLDFVPTGTMNQAVECLEIINEWEADPRIDRKLIKWMADLPYQSGVSRKFWSRVLKRFKIAIDPKAVSMLPTVTQNHNANVGFITRWLDERIERIASKQVDLRDGYTLSTKEASLIEEIFELIPEKQLTLQEQLLADIFAAPEDDDCKLVYADYLSERSDPHGEFIHLQLAKLTRPLSKVQERRERELLNKHWREFVGPLQKVIYREKLEFEKGFLSVCRVKSVGRIESLLDCPYWKTANKIYAASRSLKILKTNSQLAKHCHLAR